MSKTQQRNCPATAGRANEETGTVTVSPEAMHQLHDELDKALARACKRQTPAQQAQEQARERLHVHLREEMTRRIDALDATADNALACILLGQMMSRRTWRSEMAGILTRLIIDNLEDFASTGRDEGSGIVAYAVVKAAVEGDDETCKRYLMPFCDALDRITRKAVNSAKPERMSPNFTRKEISRFDALANEIQRAA